MLAIFQGFADLAIADLQEGLAPFLPEIINGFLLAGLICGIALFFFKRARRPAS